MESPNDVNGHDVAVTPPQPSTSGGNTLLKAALASIVLAVIKGAAFLVSGSLVALGSFFDSIGDVIVSTFNAYIQRVARKSPDAEHPFGHGGIEVLSSMAQGLVLIIFGIALVLEAVQRWTGHTRGMFDLKPEGIPFAVGILFVSAAGGFLINLMFERSRKKAGTARSLTAVADQSHYAGDAWVNLISAVGLIAIYFFKQPILDLIFGVVSAMMLAASGINVLRHCFGDILHSQVSMEMRRLIIDTAKGIDDRIQSIHRLRARQLGPTTFVDFHMTLPSQMELEEAHLLGEKVALAIRRKFVGADVIIHLDPDSEPPDELWSPN